MKVYAPRRMWFWGLIMINFDVKSIDLKSLWINYWSDILIKSPERKLQKDSEDSWGGNIVNFCSQNEIWKHWINIWHISRQNFRINNSRRFFINSKEIIFKFIFWNLSDLKLIFEVKVFVLGMSDEEQSKQLFKEKGHIGSFSLWSENLTCFFETTSNSN